MPAGHSCPGTEEGVVGLPPKLVVDALTGPPLHVIAYSTLRISVEFLDSFGTFRNSSTFCFRTATLVGSSCTFISSSVFTGSLTLVVSLGDFMTKMSYPNVEHFQ